MSTDKETKLEEMIRKIILAMTKPGELATDGECMDEVWSILKENGYDLVSVQDAQQKEFATTQKEKTNDTRCN